MTALAESCPGLALVMGFAMLCTRQARATFVCLAVQAVSVAAAAAIAQDWLMTVPPVVMLAAVWLVRHGGLTPERAAPAIPAIAAGGLLVLLCQSQGDIAQALAVVLLAIVLAAVRRHPVGQMMAIGAMTNGIVLGGELLGWDGWMPFACLALPLPLAASLILSPHQIIRQPWRRPLAITPWLGWASCAVTAAIFAATLTVPLDALASVFAPLIAFDGLLHALARRRRGAVPLWRHAALVLKLGFTLVAVCTTDPVLAWLAILGAAAAALPPAVRRRTLLAWPAAGLALLGLQMLPVEPSPVAFLSLFAGYALLAAVIPDLAVPLAVLILRLADGTVWSGAAGGMATGIALAAVLSCAVLLLRGPRRRTVLLQLVQVGIAVLAMATLEPDGRFAALVMLVLVILTRAATRIATGPSALLARAGLAGLPPAGVFPGLILVGLAIASHAPWLLVPLGMGLIPVLLAGVPARLPAVSMRTAILSVAWLPLALAALFGFFAPFDLVRWLAAITAGAS